VVRRDSEIDQIRDLKGRTIAFSSPTALASTMLVRMYLRDVGFNLDRSTTARYVSSDESALIAVAAKEADAAGVSKDGWARFSSENDYLAAQIVPRWATEELPGAAVMINDKLPAGHVRQLQKALLSLAGNEAGSLALKTAGFTQFRYGEEASYDELWEFLNNYARAFPGRAHPSRTQ
jgi:phosphonate transport system substrate-binding protein